MPSDLGCWRREVGDAVSLPRIELSNISSIILASSVTSRRIANQLTTTNGAAYDFDLALSPFTIWAYLCCGVRDLPSTDFYGQCSIASIETDIHRLRRSLSHSTPFDGHDLIAFGLRRGRYFLNPHFQCVRGTALEAIHDCLPADLRRLLDKRFPPANAA